MRVVVWRPSGGCVAPAFDCMSYNRFYTAPLKAYRGSHDRSQQGESVAIPSPAAPILR